MNTTCYLTRQQPPYPNYIYLYIINKDRDSNECFHIHETQQIIHCMTLFPSIIFLEINHQLCFDYLFNSTLVPNLTQRPYVSLNREEGIQRMLGGSRQGAMVATDEVWWLLGLCSCWQDVDSVVFFYPMVSVVDLGNNVRGQ